MRKLIDLDTAVKDNNGKWMETMVRVPEEELEYMGIDPNRDLLMRHTTDGKVYRMKRLYGNVVNRDVELYDKELYKQSIKEGGERAKHKTSKTVAVAVTSSVLTTTALMGIIAALHGCGSKKTGDDNKVAEAITSVVTEDSVLDKLAPVYEQETVVVTDELLNEYAKLLEVQCEGLTAFDGFDAQGVPQYRPLNHDELHACTFLVNYDHILSTNKTLFAKYTARDEDFNRLFQNAIKVIDAITNAEVLDDDITVNWSVCVIDEDNRNNAIYTIQTIEDVKDILASYPKNVAPDSKEGLECGVKIHKRILDYERNKRLHFTRNSGQDYVTNSIVSTIFTTDDEISNFANNGRKLFWVKYDEKGNEVDSYGYSESWEVADQSKFDDYELVLKKAVKDAKYNPEGKGELTFMLESDYENEGPKSTIISQRRDCLQNYEAEKEESHQITY